MEHNYRHSSTMLNWTEQNVASCLAWCCAIALSRLERLLENRKQYGAKEHGRTWCLVVKDHMKSIWCTLRQTAWHSPKSATTGEVYHVQNNHPVFGLLCCARGHPWAGSMSSFKAQLFLQNVETLGVWPAIHCNALNLAESFWTSLVASCHVQVQPCRALWTSHPVGQCDSWTCYEILGTNKSHSYRNPYRSKKLRACPTCLLALKFAMFTRWSVGWATCRDCAQASAISWLESRCATRASTFLRYSPWQTNSKIRKISAESCNVSFRCIPYCERGLQKATRVTESSAGYWSVANSVGFQKLRTQITFCQRFSDSTRLFCSLHCFAQPPLGKSSEILRITWLQASWRPDCCINGNLIEIMSTARVSTQRYWYTNMFAVNVNVYVFVS